MDTHTRTRGQVLERWFESEPLRTTLATDAVIGAMTSPSQPQSGYVLFHHVMGEVDGEKGAWGYVRGGMGALSEAIAASARSHGATIRTEAEVDSVLMDGDRAAGVVLSDQTEIHADAVFCNASPSGASCPGRRLHPPHCAAGDSLGAPAARPPPPPPSPAARAVRPPGSLRGAAAVAAPAHAHLFNHSRLHQDQRRALAPPAVCLHAGGGGRVPAAAPPGHHPL